MLPRIYSLPFFSYRAHIFLREPLMTSISVYVWVGCLYPESKGRPGQSELKVHLDIVIDT